MNVDLKEFRAAFVAEAEEHLSSVQSLLLDVERATSEGRTTPRELRELLRLLHTIKGLSAMVGVEPIVILAHKMETVLKAAERAGAAPDRRAIEVVLSAARAIETRVRSVADEKPVPPPAAELLRELENVEPPLAGPPDLLPFEPSIAAKVGASEQQQLRTGARGGRRAVRVDFAPSAEKAGRGVTITNVRERLAPIAEIVKVLPISSSAGPTAPNGLVFALLLLTEASNEAIAAAVYGEADAVSTLFAEEANPPALALPVDPGDDNVYSDSGRGVLRVDVGRIDDAIEMLGGLVVTRSRMAHAIDRLETSGANTRELRTILTDNARQLRELRAAILRVRMVPMAAVLERLPLVVRGLARTMKKQVEVTLDAGTAELDKTVAERIFPALVHLMRNAVDHGVESPQDRVARGKAATATVAIESTARDRFVELRISDDGDGIDRVRLAARSERPVPTSNAELLDLLCQPGLSTRASADETSGRGLGMDIVRQIVGRLGGEVALETERGVGTSFILRIPLTVAIVDAFTVRCAGERYAIPVPIVEEIIELADARVVIGPSPSQRGARLLSRRGETVPIFDLSEALARSSREPDRRDAPHGLIVRRAHGELVGYAVERVLGQQEIVVRPLVDKLVASYAVSGSTDLGDGRATLVLDLVALNPTTGRAPLGQGGRAA